MNETCQIDSLMLLQLDLWPSGGGHTEVAASRT